MSTTEKILQTMSSWHWGELIVECSRQGLGGSSRSTIGYYRITLGHHFSRHTLPELSTNLREDSVAGEVGALNKEKALVGAFSGHCETSRRFVDGSTLYSNRDIRRMHSYMLINWDRDQFLEGVCIESVSSFDSGWKWKRIFRVVSRHVLPSRETGHISAHPGHCSALHGSFWSVNSLHLSKLRVQTWKLYWRREGTRHDT